MVLTAVLTGFNRHVAKTTTLLPSAYKEVCMHGFTNEGRSAMMPESVLYAFSVMSDKEAQEDELVALASIYDKDIFSISSDQEGEREIPGGEFCANLDLPQPFYVHLQATPQKGMD